VSLEVRDDGKGGAAQEGSGLSGMRERARALGGDVVRDVTAGTRLLVSLPLAGGAAAP
jgi:two-component system sensor histidine kinase DesK